MSRQRSFLQREVPQKEFPTIGGPAGDDPLPRSIYHQNSSEKTPSSSRKNHHFKLPTASLTKHPRFTRV